MSETFKYEKGQTVKVLSGEYADRMVRVVGQPKGGDVMYRCELLGEHRFISVGEKDLSPELEAVAV